MITEIKQADRLNAFYLTLQEITSSLQLDQVLYRIVERAAYLLACDSVTLRLLDNEGKKLALVQGYNLSKDYLRKGTLIVGESVAGLVVKEGKPLVIENIKEDERYKYKDFAEAEGFISSLSVPLKTKDQSIGSLTVYNKQPHHYTEEETFLLSAFANLAAITIENTRFYDKITRRLKEISLLYDVTIASTHTLELDSLLQRFLNAIRKLLPFPDFSILLINEPTAELVQKKETRYRNLTLNPETIRIPLGKGNTGWVAKTGEPLLIPDVSKDQRYLAINPETRSELCVPLKVRSKVIGVINVESPKINAFSEEDLRFLSIFAGTLAGLIENVRLVRENIKLSVTDPLTGIYNRRAFYKTLEKEIARNKRYGGTTSLIMFDLDRFKEYNDIYGHQAGDRFLKKFTLCILKNCREVDILARYGGDEFIIILPGTNTNSALSTVERIKTKFEVYLRRKKGISNHITFSASVVNYPQDGNTIEKLIQKLDNSLYTAKWLGGNGICWPGKITLDFIQNQILKIIEQKDNYTYRHSKRVAKYAVSLAEELKLFPDQIEIIRMAGFLHDAGNIGIPEIILNKPSRLNEREWKIIQAHPRHSAGIISLSSLPREILPIIISHHERYDGKGYPQGLKGEKIPLGARILGLVDTYDALTHNRPHRQAFSKKEALLELEKNSGAQFDPQLVQTFVKIIKKTSSSSHQ